MMDAGRRSSSASLAGPSTAAPSPTWVLPTRAAACQGPHSIETIYKICIHRKMGQKQQTGYNFKNVVH